MKELILACICGIIVGVIFRLTKLPMPAPNGIAGIVGILGIYLGFKLVEYLKVFPWFKL